MRWQYTPLGYGNLDIRLGSHIAFLYAQEEELLSSLPLLVKGGLDNQEQCVLVMEVEKLEKIRQLLLDDGIDVKEFEAKSQLRFFSDRHSFKTGRKSILDLLLEQCRRFVMEGYDGGWKGTRVILDMLFLDSRLTQKEEKLIEYEARMEEIINKKDIPLNLICQYDLNRITGKQVLNLITVHSMVMYGDLTKEDPYFTKLRSRAFQDELTKLHNYWYFSERLQEEIDRASRYRGTFSILLVDIKDFKLVNEKYGYLKGDQVLIEMARLLQDNIRKVDVVSRYGGDEFVVLLPETHKKNASVLAKRLLNAVKDHVFFLSDEKIDFTVAVNLGIVNFPLDSCNAEELMLLIEKALLSAKKENLPFAFFSSIGLEEETEL